MSSIPTAVDNSTSINAAYLNSIKAAVEDLESGAVRAGSLNIGGLTAETSIDMAADYAAILDSSGNVIRKVLLKYFHPITTKGDLTAGGASGALTRLAVGADGYVLTAASGEATGLKWEAIPASAYPEMIWLSAAPLHEGSASWVVTNGTWRVTSTDSGHMWGGCWDNGGATPADGNRTTKTFRAPETGDYSLRWCCLGNTDCGQIQADLDGTDKGSVFDAYRGSLSYNLWSEAVSLGSLTRNAQYTLGLRASGKNASSSGYYVGLQVALIYRTA